MQTRGPWILLPENRAARQAFQRVRACVVKAGPRRIVNPLFVHGPTGAGKSHLIHDLIEEATQHAPALVVALVSAPDLLGPDAEEETRMRREADLVVVEDVQHLPQRAHETLVALVDRALARHRQLVLTATLGPGLLPLPVRLTSRLAQGLVVALEPLCVASRIEVLRVRARERGLEPADDVLAWLAHQTPGSVRQLEGTLTRLDLLARALGRLPTFDEVKTAFTDDADSRRLTIERIAQRVSRYFQVAPRDLRSRGRSREVLLPRQVSMYLARQLTPLSLEQIGAYFGGRDHSTVLHACRKVEEALPEDARLSGAVRELHAELA